MNYSLYVSPASVYKDLVIRFENHPQQMNVMPKGINLLFKGLKFLQRGEEAQIRLKESVKTVSYSSQHTNPAHHFPRFLSYATPKLILMYGKRGGHQSLGIQLIEILGLTRKVFVLEQRYSKHFSLIRCRVSKDLESFSFEGSMIITCFPYTPESIEGPRILGT